MTRLRYSRICFASEIGGITHELDDTGLEFPRVAAVEAGWHVVAHKIDASVARINGVLAPVLLAIGVAGEPGWSYKNFSFGFYRRIRLHEPSIAWLHIELTSDRKFSLKLRAHRQEQALMNEAVLVPADALAEHMASSAWPSIADARAGAGAWQTMHICHAGHQIRIANGSTALRGLHQPQ